MMGGPGGNPTAGGTQHARLFTGKIWYVDAGMAASGDGKTPDTALKTITEAITACSAGDAIGIKAGTYAENVVVNKDAVELWPEIGTIIAPGSGTPLTVSAHYCKVVCTGGSLRLNPVANGTGMLVSGNWAYTHDIRVPAGRSGDLGFDIRGTGCVGTNLRCSDPLVAAFKIQGDKVKLEDCCTGATPADTSIGYWLTNTCDKARIKNCASQGHATSSVTVDAGCTNYEVCNFSSGGGDGPKVDNGTSGTFPGYTFDNVLHKNMTFDGSTRYNLFKLTGAVRISDIHGVVTTVLANTASTLYLNLYSSAANVDITDRPGTQIRALVAGSLFVRNEDSTNDIDIAEPKVTPAIAESSNYRDPKTEIDIVKDDTNDTYVCVVISDALASGTIHWHCEFEPLSDDGWLESV